MDENEKTRARNIFYGIGSLSIQNLINSILGFVFLTVVLRTLSPSDYGIYSASQLVVSASTAIASWGIGNAAVKYLSGTNEGMSYFKACFVMTLILTSLVTLFVFLLSPYISFYFSKTGNYADVFRFSCIWLYTSTISSLFQAALQGLRRYTLLASVLIISKLSSVVSSIFLLVIYKNTFAAITGLIIYSILSLILSLPFIKINFSLKASLEHYYEILKFATPIAVASIISFISGSLDLFVVGGYLNQTSLGIYNAAVTISGVISMLIVVPLTTAFFPEVSLSSSSDQQVNRGFGIAFRLLFITIVPFSLYVSAVSPQLVKLFSGGGAYLSGVFALQIISSFYLLGAISSLANSLFQGIGKTLTVLVIVTFAAFTDLFLSLFFVPKFGLLGASAARVGSSAAGASLALYFSRGYLSKKIAGFVLKILTISLFILFLFSLLTRYFSSNISSLLPYSVLALFVYAASLKASKVLQPEDKLLLSYILPRSLKQIIDLL